MAPEEIHHGGTYEDAKGRYLIVIKLPGDSGDVVWWDPSRRGWQEGTLEDFAKLAVRLIDAPPA